MNYKFMSKSFNEKTLKALHLQHIASQFIAITGKHLIEEKEDDSHTNMTFVSDKALFVGKTLPNQLHVALQIESLYLQIVKEDLTVVKQFALEGKSKLQAFNLLKQCLSDTGLDVTSLSQELHYEMPDYEFTDESIFSFDDNDLFEQNALYRHNAEVVFKDIVSSLKKEIEINVWPHHFDTGSFIPLKHDDNGDLSQSFGMGFAIPDTMIDEPYFYLSFWSSEVITELETPPALPYGIWMMPIWNGAVLRLSDILRADSDKDQLAIIKSFYSEGLKVLSQYLPIY